MNVQKLILAFFIVVGATITSCSKDDTVAVETKIIPYDFEAIVDEMPPMGYEIGQLLASTNRGTLTYTLLEQSAHEAIAVDGATGKLTVSNPAKFVYELNPIITATTRVSNDQVSEEIKITLTLTKAVNKKVYNGTINLRSQEDVNAFGSEDYTHISGTLNIGKFLDGELSDIHDLSPLTSLEYIGKNLIVGLNPELTILNELDNLTHNSSMIFISSNKQLRSIQILKNVPGHYLTLFIENNEALENLNGLEKLETLTGLRILDNP